ncbi:MAG TPA: hypothetical protein VGG63_04465 [Steroidobacteraceae bacterium]
MTDTESAPALVAAFRGAVTCSRTAEALILSGCAADSADDRLILTLISPSAADLPGSLTAATVHDLGAHRYRIGSSHGDFVVEASSVHLHRDIGKTFYRAVPPRPVPLGKRVFWRLVLWLAGTSTGKRLLTFLRRQA